jgi:NAD(P)-dependent dehydrogenase (short-subunit alcohol dehydrogenase family)
MKKTVLITGTSSGFGKATAKLFAKNGWNVVATMRRPEKEKELVGLDDVLVTQLDVQDRASIAQAIEAGIARFGRIDGLINNAGFGLFGVFEATSQEKIQEQFDVNVFGVMDVTRAILPHFRKNKGGLIINVSSGAGIFTLPMISPRSRSIKATLSRMSICCPTAIYGRKRKGVRRQRRAKPRSQENDRDSSLRSE